MVKKELLEKLVDEGYASKQKHNSLPLHIYKYTKTAQYEQKWGTHPSLLKLRGYITDTNGNFVAKGFSKFFNYEEPESEEIVNITKSKITNSVVKKKYDGSLIIIFYYEGDWHTATNGSFHSDQSIKANKILREKFSLRKFNKDYTYLAEFIGPSNRIVVDYPEDTLMFIGANKKGKRICCEQELFLFKESGIPQSNVFEYFPFSGHINSLKSKNIENEEGYVISNEFGCFKIKFEDYVYLHKIMTNLTTKDVWESLKNCTFISLENVPDEYFNKIKEYKQNLINEYQYIESEATKIFMGMQACGLLKTRKEFAKQVLKLKKPYSVLLFQMIDNKDISKAIWDYLKPKTEKL